MAALASEANKERTHTKSIGTGATILTEQPDGDAQFNQFLEAVENVLPHCTVYHSPLHFYNTTNMLMEHIEVPSPALSDSRLIIEVSL